MNNQKRRCVTNDYLKFICNNSVFNLDPCTIFNMHMTYAYLIYLITAATVDLLTNLMVLVIQLVASLLLAMYN
jgi:hypothetical protein